ncbi:response regulator [Cohnella thailandensis]|uniref:Response regulator n=1 Tax=Cohnella thailandensis TaxID=557557 RepID=A0A841T437_9BACL|nr:response regulator [Cohnella thailandensis]MBB6637118.1 response regulator [Cohnella thailandensis]MBP1977064.1 AraC-like DNA-binding protein/DNA-binding NarL/FixJ family response regulator [Cohnella thailandensis]
MYKVVIVDDEMIVRHAVRSLIRWEGSRFEYAGSAANGVAALELVNRLGADIVITDMKMNEMDGLELIKQLQSGGFAGEVLVLSNYNDFDLVREALKRGAHDYMLKLTLKSEQFMQVLEEMASKLDEKRAYAPNGRARTQAEAPDGSGGRREAREAAGTRDLMADPDWTARMNRILQQMESSGEHPDPSEEEELAAYFAARAGACCYPFYYYLQENDKAECSAVNHRETLLKLADGLFPGHRDLFVVTASPRRFLLVVACPSRSIEPEEAARRMIRLSKMYYNLDANVIYGEPATGGEKLLEQLRLCRQADQLRFYSSRQEGFCSNEVTVADGHEGFREAETKLRDTLRRTSGFAIELWMESALLLVEAAAKFSIRPYVLKRAIAGGIWGVANAPILGEGLTWNEKPWIERAEAAESDSQLMLLIRELSEEVMGLLEKTAALPATREEVRQAISYLEKHFAERIFISEVASHVGLSEPYLCQVFKAETGTSILTRLNEIRMARAYELLASGKYLIKQAAIEVGIPDPFYFNRLFKKRFGIAPKNVKKRQEKMDDFKMP